MDLRFHWAGRLSEDSTEGKSTMKKLKKGYEHRRKIPEMSKIGYQHLKAGRFNEAEAEFTKILKLAKKDIYALVGLGDLYLAQREFEKALDCYNKALQVQEDALRDGYIVSADYDYDASTDTYLVFCTTIIDGDIWYWDPETDEPYADYSLGKVK